VTRHGYGASISPKGVAAVYEKLKSRFPRGKRKGGGTETETVTETIKKEVSVTP
jgi:hypothetical protein